MSKFFRGGVLALVLLPALALADQYVLYLHGRLEQEWKHPTASLPGFANVTFLYDGNARLADWKVSRQLHDAFGKYCGAHNSCVIVCFSAGCMRTLKALDELRAEKVPLEVLWVEAAASAAGGTALAERSNVILGEPIDADLRREVARGRWAFIQDAMASNVMYHVAGRRDFCPVTGCGNWFLPPGMCDGALCVDSAGGASRSGSYFDGCALAANPGVYPGRVWDRANAPCKGLELHHNQVADYVAEAVAHDGGASRAAGDGFLVGGSRLAPKSLPEREEAEAVAKPR
jgi:hypothetical protein